MLDDMKLGIVDDMKDNVNKRKLFLRMIYIMYM